MRIASLFVGCLCYLGIVFADTEIINFQLPFPSPSPSSVLGDGNGANSIVTPDLISLKPSQPITTNLTSASPEKHLMIDFEGEDNAYEKWTIRVSWPGSSPTQITLKPPGHSGRFSIRGSELSPRMYHPLVSRLINQYIYSSSPTQASSTRKPEEEFHTPISVVLEPLILGSIPKTALPTIGIIVILVIILAFNMSRILLLVESAMNWVAHSDGHDKKE